MSILEARGVGLTFGGLRAVHDFNLTIEEGESVAIIGPNGAGKTTSFNLLTGIYKPTDGDILIGGTSILKKLPHQISQMGVARTFQNIRLFHQLSVLDNVKVAMKCKATYGFADAILHTKKYKREEQMIEEKSHELLDLFGMDGVSHLPAGNLPYGEQRKLEIVRALATDPKLLCLDEPAAGMNQVEIEEVMGVIMDVRKKFDISVLLIEHHMSMVMKIAERIKVLDFGETIAEGSPEEIQNNPYVIEAYLGKGEERQ
ncbi:MAG: ABC transporter ATP-binding protein [Blautia sp.]